MSLLPTIIWLNMSTTSSSTSQPLAASAPQAEHGLPAGISMTGRGSAKEKNLSPSGRKPVEPSPVCLYATSGSKIGYPPDCAAEKEAEMKRRYRMQARKRMLGSALAALGVMVWLTSAALGLASHD